MYSIIHHTHNSKTLRRERRWKALKVFVEYLDSAAAVALGLVLIAEFYEIAKLLSA